MNRFSYALRDLFGVWLLAGVRYSSRDDALAIVRALRLEIARDGSTLERGRRAVCDEVTVVRVVVDSRGREVAAVRPSSGVALDRVEGLSR
jgi:hypothetical protein